MAQSRELDPALLSSPPEAPAKRTRRRARLTGTPSQTISSITGFGSGKRPATRRGSATANPLGTVNQIRPSGAIAVEFEEPLRTSPSTSPSSVPDQADPPRGRFAARRSRRSRRARARSPPRCGRPRACRRGRVRFITLSLPSPSALVSVRTSDVSRQICSPAIVPTSIRSPCASSAVTVVSPASGDVITRGVWPSSTNDAATPKVPSQIRPDRSRSMQVVGPASAGSSVCVARPCGVDPRHAAESGHQQRPVRARRAGRGRPG